jgi:hypothetical protein
MSQYLRCYMVGGPYFFTVNLQDRKTRTIGAHVDCLRAVVAG